MSGRYRPRGYTRQVRLLRLLGRLSDPIPLSSGVLLGLERPAEVALDAFGQPRLEAATEHDVYFVQGFLHARDRFFQMDLARRMPGGRLSELLGPEGLAFDRFYRPLGVARAVSRTLAALDSDVLRMLAAYSQGVNAALQDGLKPPEHRLLGVEPEPWRVEDSLTTAYQLAWALNNMWAIKWAVSELRDDPHAIALIAGSGEGALSVLGGLGSAEGGGSGIGSNNWVVAGSRTATGFPLLANDPHLMGTLPSIWYPMHLRGPNLDVFGMSLAGAPGIIIGQTSEIAWGVTNVDPDVQDLIRISPTPSRDAFLGPAGPVRLRERPETLVVRGGKAELVRVFDTEWGPVIRELPGGDMLVLRWNGLVEPPPIRAVYRLNRARNWADFEEALRDWHVPAQHFVYADHAGHIGYRLGGQVFRSAVRPGVLDARRHDLAPREVMPFAERPHLYDPDEGFIVTANNPPTGADAPNRVDGAYTLGTRARRIREQIVSVQVHTRETFQTLQTDVFSAPLLTLASRLLEHPHLPPAWREVLSDFRGEVRADCTAVTHLYLVAEALIPEPTRRSLLRPFFQDHDPGAPGSHPFPERFIDLVGERLIPWVTANLDSLDLRAALSAADRTGELSFGRDRREWTWGRAHRLRLFHPFTAEPLVAPVFARRDVALGGSHTTVNQTAFPVGPHLPWPRTIAYLPSMRVVFDLENPARSEAVHLTGSSGHPVSPYYDDLLTLYVEDRRIPIGPGMETATRVAFRPG